jgi:uncharacterized protein
MSRTLTVLLAAVCLAFASNPAPAGEGKVRVVLIDGQNNHNWRATSPLMKRVLEDSGRFTVEVSSNLRSGDMPGSLPTVPFPPDLTKYDVVVSNYNGAPWPDAFNQALERRLRNRGIGLVIVHAANNAFPNWQQYNRMIGMGWRGPEGGEALIVRDSGEWIRVPTRTGLGSGHRYTGPFTVTVRDDDHPVTRGMPKEWLHAQDELYDNMRGPIENIRLLATAYSKGTMAHEPMIWTVKYGRGRVFHTPMGHDLNGMRCVGFVTTLTRGTEWAATGDVSIPIPKAFPTAKGTSSLPPG